MTLPLLLVAVAPLLIASFAFNFNNFNNIYLLTGGGPPVGGPVRRGRDRHPDQLHVQARVRGRQGHRLRPRERRLDPDLLHRRRNLGLLVLAFPITGEHAMTTADHAESRTAALRAHGRRAGGRSRQLLQELVAARGRADRGRLRALPGRVHRLGGVQRRRHARRRVPDPARRSRSTTSARSSPARSRSPARRTRCRTCAGTRTRSCVAVAHRDHDRPARRARRLRVQPLPLPRPADRDAGAAPDPDVPADARRGRDLPDRPQRGRASSR